MQEIWITEIRPKEKGKLEIRFASGVALALYRSELRALTPQEEQMLRQDGHISEALYRKLTEMVTLRAKKRAMYLLMRMERTERQLREKLTQNGYPAECIDGAVDYVKQFHYVDDLRYAKNYVRYRQEKKSRKRLEIDLQKKGVSGDLIERALCKEFVSDETEQIRELLARRHYDAAEADDKTRRRTWQFLLRRGFCSSDILGAMSGKK